MKFVMAVFVTMVLAWVGGLFLPWWSVAIASFVAAIVFSQGRGRAWFAGFLGIFILWAIASVTINIRNEGILAPKIANILPLNGSVPVLILLTALVGGLVGGMGALSAAFLTGVAKK
jgi:hypothetical protein